MKKYWSLAVVVILVVLAMVGCKKKTNPQLLGMEKFAAAANDSAGKVLPNGQIFRRIDYKAGDSVFVYHIEVGDDRLNKLTSDSVRAVVKEDLSSPKMKKLITVLVKNSIGLQYIYEVRKSGENGTSEVVVRFTPAELADINK